LPGLTVVTRRGASGTSDDALGAGGTLAAGGAVADATALAGGAARVSVETGSAMGGSVSDVQAMVQVKRRESGTASRKAGATVQATAGRAW